MTSVGAGLIAIGIGLAVGLPGLGSGLGQGTATRGAMDAIARQPEATNDVRGTLILALAFMEAITIYGLLLGLLLSGKV